MRPANDPAVPPAGPFVRPFARWVKRLASKPALGLLAASMAFLAGTVPLRADEIPVGCTGSALGINLFTDTRDVHVGDTIRYSVTIFNGLPGSPPLGSLVDIPLFFWLHILSVGALLTVVYKWTKQT